jgi:EAL domain-containing protein (putative c-di-GMP-specific phosphodiesterase class I)
MIIELDCAYAQGYRYARPMPATAAANFAVDWATDMPPMLAKVN